MIGKCVAACKYDALSIVDGVAKVDKELCVGCGACSKACPNGAISVVQKLATIDYTKCTGCGLCATVCPKKLIASHVEDASQVDLTKV